MLGDARLQRTARCYPVHREHTTGDWCLNSVTMPVNPTRRRSWTLRTAVVVAGIVIGFLVVLAMIDPHMTWFLEVPSARLTVDGRPAKGWLHKGNHNQTLFLTRATSGGQKSYMIWAPGDGRGSVRGCGSWTSPHFPIFAIGDVNPPCSPWLVSGETGTAFFAQSVVIGKDLVEFTAEDGSRVKVSW